MAKEAKINPVGFIKANKPIPYWYTFTITSLPILVMSLLKEKNIINTFIYEALRIKTQR